MNENKKEVNTEEKNNINNGGLDIEIPGVKKVDYAFISENMKNQVSKKDRTVISKLIGKHEKSEKPEEPEKIEKIEKVNDLNGSDNLSNLNLFDFNGLNIKKVDYSFIYSNIKNQAIQNKIDWKSTLKNNLKFNIIIVLLFSAYILLNVINIAIYREDIFDVENNINVNLFYLILTLIAVFLIVFAIYIIINIIFDVTNFQKYVLLFSSLLFAVGLVTNRPLNIFFSVTVLAVLFYVIEYSLQEEDVIKIDALNEIISFKHVIIFVSILAVVYTAVVSYAGILKYRSYYNSTFDFGIFAQMFENMAKTGSQVTSVERNMHISHFAVHFSPIFYLVLPFYMVYREPQTILVIQAALIAAGVYPLILIAKKFRFTNVSIILIALTYIFYPSLTGGAFYDFHENKFLTVLILWLMYFIMREKQKNQDWIFVYVFVILTLMVKEDAFMYVFFIGLYIAFIRNRNNNKLILKNIIHGAAISVLSLLYFLGSTYYLRTYGLGVMTIRYEVFLTMYEDGFMAMIRNVIKNPALLLGSLVSVPEKLDFILYMLVPLCFLPFASKKLRFIVLIIPMIIMNLATNYIYQYDVNFQYTYGVTALLFFAALKNLSEFGGNGEHYENGEIHEIHENHESEEPAPSPAKQKPRRIIKFCVTMACFSLILFMSNNFNKIHMYNFIWNQFKEDFIETDEILSRIPMDASVTANTFMVPHLIKRENVYAANVDDFDYLYYDTEYLVNDLRQIDIEYYDIVLKTIYNRGYRKVDAGIMVEVFKKESERDRLY